MIASLEDSMVTMGTISSSRYVTGIRAEVDRVENQLNHFSETLDEWLTVQRNWMYLESIFSAPDIQRQLPSEAKQFFAVDKNFKEVMRRTKDRPSALQTGLSDREREKKKSRCVKIKSSRPRILVSLIFLT